MVQLRRFLRKKTAVAAALYLLFLVALALLAGLISPHDPLKVYSAHTLEGPSREFIMGTDNLGRDILSRIVFGARVSLKVGLLAVSISAVIGTTMGMLAGYLGGWTDQLVMRVVDVMLAIPGILLALIIIAALGPSMNNLIVAVGISGVPTYARLVRGTVLSAREREYVEAARALGAQRGRIMWKHILPNVLAPILVLASLGVGVAILSTAGLSFIGLGVRPPIPEWGSMLSDARTYLRDAWWMFTFPGLAISTTVLSANLLGDALRDVFDPRLKS
jgi:peptide/nickel transport system permease protein